MAQPLVQRIVSEYNSDDFKKYLADLKKAREEQDRLKQSAGRGTGRSVRATSAESKALKDLRQTTQEARIEFDKLNLANRRGEISNKQFQESVQKLSKKVAPALASVRNSFEVIPRTVEIQYGRAMVTLDRFRTRAQEIATGMTRLRTRIGQSIQDQLMFRIPGGHLLRGLGLGARSLTGIGLGVAAAAGIAKATSLAIKYEEALSDVRKTTGMTREETEELGEALLDLSTHLGTNERDLAAIAATAGQLGIRGQESIVQFTDTVAKLAAVSDLTAEEAAQALGKLGNAFNLPISASEGLGSVVNQLSNDMGTSSGEIVEALQNVAPAAENLGITVDQVAAFSAILIESGIDANRAGTMLRNVITLVQTRAGDLAKVLGVTGEAFRQMLTDDPIDALEQYFKALAKLPPQLATIEIDKTFGRRNLLAIQLLAAATEQGADGVSKFSKALLNSSAAIKEATSLQEEFAIKMETTTGQWNLLLQRGKAAAMGFVSFINPQIRKHLTLLNKQLEFLGLISKQEEELAKGPAQQLSAEERFRMFGFGPPPTTESPKFAAPDPNLSRRIKDLQEEREALVESGEATERLAEVNRELNEALAEQARLQKFGLPGTDIDRAREALEKITGSLQVQNSLTSEQKNLLGEVFAVKERIKQLDELAKTLGKEAVSEQRAQLEERLAKTQELIEAEEGLSRAIRSGAEGLTDLFASIDLSAIKPEELSETVGAIIKDFQQEIQSKIGLLELKIEPDMDPVALGAIEAEIAALNEGAMRTMEALFAELEARFPKMAELLSGLFKGVFDAFRVPDEAEREIIAKITEISRAAEAEIADLEFKLTIPGVSDADKALIREDIAAIKEGAQAQITELFRETEADGIKFSTALRQAFQKAFEGFAVDPAMVRKMSADFGKILTDLQQQAAPIKLAIAASADEKEKSNLQNQIDELVQAAREELRRKLEELIADLIASGASPAIIASVQAVVDSIQSGITAVGTETDKAGESARKLAQIFDLVATALASIERFADVFGGMSDNVKDVIGSTADLLANLSRIAETKAAIEEGDFGLGSLQAIAGIAIPAIGALAGVAGLFKGLGGLGAFGGDFTSQNKALEEQVKATRDLQETLREAARDIARSVDRLASSTDVSGRDLNRFSGIIEGMSDAFETLMSEGTLGGFPVADTENAAQALLDNLFAQLETLDIPGLDIEALRQWAETLIKGGAKVSDVFAALLNGGMGLSEGLFDMRDLLAQAFGPSVEEAIRRLNFFSQFLGKGQEAAADFAGFLLENIEGLPHSLRELLTGISTGDIDISTEAGKAALETALKDLALLFKEGGAAILGGLTEADFLDILSALQGFTGQVEEVGLGDAFSDAAQAARDFARFVDAEDVQGAFDVFLSVLRKKLGEDIPESLQAVLDSLGQIDITTEAGQDELQAILKEWGEILATGSDEAIEAFAASLGLTEEEFRQLIETLGGFPGIEIDAGGAGKALQDAAQAARDFAAFIDSGDLKGAFEAFVASLVRDRDNLSEGMQNLVGILGDIDLGTEEGRNRLLQWVNLIGEALATGNMTLIEGLGLTEDEARSLAATFAGMVPDTESLALRLRGFQDALRFADRLDLDRNELRDFLLRDLEGFGDETTKAFAARIAGIDFNAEGAQDALDALIEELMVSILDETTLDLFGLTADEANDLVSALQSLEEEATELANRFEEAANGLAQAARFSDDLGLDANELKTIFLEKFFGDFKPPELAEGEPATAIPLTDLDLFLAGIRGLDLDTREGQEALDAFIQSLQKAIISEDTLAAFGLTEDEALKLVDSLGVLRDATDTTADALSRASDQLSDAARFAEDLGLSGADLQGIWTRGLEAMGDKVDQSLVSKLKAIDISTPEGQAQWEALMQQIMGAILAGTTLEGFGLTEEQAEQFLQDMGAILTASVPEGEGRVSRSVQFLRTITEFQGNELVINTSHMAFRLDEIAERALMLVETTREILASMAGVPEIPASIAPTLGVPAEVAMPEFDLEAALELPPALQAALAEIQRVPVSPVSAQTIQNMTVNRNLNATFGDLILNRKMDEEDARFVAEWVYDEIRRKQQSVF